MNKYNHHVDDVHLVDVVLHDDVGELERRVTDWGRLGDMESSRERE